MNKDGSDDQKKPSCFVTIDLTYLEIFPHLGYIVEPYSGICLGIFQDNLIYFQKAPGSTHNHQAWVGGYIDHVTDGMNYARALYKLQSALGRPMQFSESDALLVFFLHDIEKPWRILVTPAGEAINRPGLDTKELYRAFREKKLAEYGLVLTPVQMNALTYVEGEGSDYSSKHRVMNELAAFCHQVDVWSARQCYDYPKPADEDEWVGADRFRAKKP